MAWWHAFGIGRGRLPEPEAAPPRQTLTAAAVPVAEPRPDLLRTEDTWQDELWEFYDSLGEFRYAADWKASMLSRVRLCAARLEPGEDEPVRAKAGTAVDLMSLLGGGVPGQAQLMDGFGTHLTVPGECYLVGENTTGTETWSVRSVSEIRARNGRFEVLDERAVSGYRWRPLSGDSMVTRVWRRHKRSYHLADSPARAARAAMRELELNNRYILSQYLSRLASAGVIVFPDEITFPVREEFADADDPFMAEWVEIAAEAIRTPGTASGVVPIPVRVPGELVDKIRHVDFTLKIDEKILDKRDSAIKRLATQLNLPAEVLLGMGDVNHWCTLRHVRIMTRAGWKTYGQLTVGEEVLTLNHDTGLSEWQPLLAVNTWNVTDEPMVTITGRRHSSTTSLNHRWPILSGTRAQRGREWTTTVELMQQAKDAGEDTQRQEYLVLAAPSADLPAEPKYQDALVELVAWYFTEGDLGRRPGRSTPRVRINQSHVVNPDNCTRIRRALTAMFGPESTALDKGGRYSTPDSTARREEARRLRAENPNMPAAEIGRRLGASGTMVAKYLSGEAKVRDAVPRWREQVNQEGRITRFLLNAAAGKLLLTHAPGRVVNLDFIQQLTAAQLELFIDTAIRGDGHIMGGSTPVIGQKDPAMLDAFELACILSGRSVNRYGHSGGGRSADGPRMETRHVVSATNRSVTFAPRGRSFEEITYTGTIWCPTTPNRSWLAEDDGHVFFTGNSAWQIDEAALKTTIAPDAELICGALTTGYLQPRLKASGVKDWARWVAWYDMSELTQRPDKSRNAFDAYDRLEINGAALRRETGFVEADKPTGRALLEQGLKVIIKSLPSGAGSALSQLVGRDIVITPVAAVQPEDAGAGAAGGSGDPPPEDTERSEPSTGDAGHPLPARERAPGARNTGAGAGRLRQARMLRQARTPHAVRFTLGNVAELLHPPSCAEHAHSCPFTHAAAGLDRRPRPGTTGVYEARLDTSGRLVIGRPVPLLDTSRFVPTPPRSAHGHNHSRR